jgi:undecaprenyl-diphosphatase
MNTSPLSRQTLILTFALCLFSFVLLLFALLKGTGLDVVDHQISQFFYRLRNPDLNLFVLDFSALGAPAVTGTLSFLTIILLVLSRAKIAALYLGVVMGGVSVWSPLLKAFAHRDRPELGSRLLEVTGYSFPSGHALGSTCLYLGLFFISTGYFTRALARRITLGLTLTLLIAIAATRIFLGAHYASDVLGGMLLGTTWTTLVLLFFRTFEEKLIQRKTESRLD